MKLIKDNRGVTAYSIMLLALLVLALVLLNGISISLKNNEKARASVKTGTDVAINYCGATHQIFPRECIITRVYECDGNFILRSGCLGVGDVILNKNGEYANWCGYTSLDGELPNCGEYWLDVYGQDCIESNNLCL